METVGAMSELNWSSFNGMLSSGEAEFMEEFLGSYPSTNEQDSNPNLEIPPTFWSDLDTTSIASAMENSCYYYSDTVNSSQYSWPQGNSNGVFVPTSTYENYYMDDFTNALLGVNNSSVSMDLCMGEEQITSSPLLVVTDNLFDGTACLNEEISGGDLGESVVLSNRLQQPKRKLHVIESDKANKDDDSTNPTENPKKKSRVSGNVQRNAKSAQSKKNQKTVMIAKEEDSNAALNGQSSCSYSSEDDSNSSQELNGGVSSSSKGTNALNLNGKSRASRGSATDPQSLYARKRRERINERLKILQNLVPNGTKVDISTMLEEAVEYVKFLQVQIKLLSSDDLWMYAPIAYNGIDIGLDRNISAL
ncbi:uncharacterized protein LOC143855134 [Tasmannia lanceolata]|uniref:uncharacterized protein LOC143855134 n=1 Tax=Tasmannia lanceolata TaxID=3420 RepID=UPI004063E4AB